MFGTNIFAEIWNDNRTWTGGIHCAVACVRGLDIREWRGATMVITGHMDTSLLQGQSRGKPSEAIGGSLVKDGRQFNDGWVFFNTEYLPPYCE